MKHLQAVQVPLIVSVPWLPTQTARNDHLVELVDIMPTIMALSGVAGLSAQEARSNPLSGRSLVPLLLNASSSKAQNFALSQYPRRVKYPKEEWKSNSILHLNRSKFTHMGYTIRTEQWRYTEWAAWDGVGLQPMWSEPWNTTVNELYDHSKETLYPIDFDDRSETVNVVTMHERIAKNLSNMIRARFPSK